MAYVINKIYEILKREIINLDLIPGTKLREEDLAKRFEISRTPIRSVISRLENEGLVEVISQKGTYVTRIDADKVDDYIYIRKTIENNVIEEVINKITRDQIEKLNEILIEQKQIIEMPYSIERGKKFFHNDNLFHKTLFSFAKREGTWTIIHSEATALNRVRMMSNLRKQTQVENIYEQHCLLVKYLSQHDLRNALLVFRDHIDGGFDGISAVQEKYPNYFL